MARIRGKWGRREMITRPRLADADPRIGEEEMQKNEERSSQKRRAGYNHFYRRPSCRDPDERTSSYRNLDLLQKGKKKGVGQELMKTLNNTTSERKRVWRLLILQESRPEIGGRGPTLEIRRGGAGETGGKKENKGAK